MSIQLRAASARPADGGRQQRITLGCGVPHGLRPLAHWRERIKLHCRAACYPGHTRNWLRLLNADPVLREVARHCPRLLHKIYRPYLTRQLPMRERLALLAYHYDFMRRLGLGSLVAQAARAPVPLAGVSGKKGTHYSVVLRAAATLEREGELILQLHADDALVYSVAFTFSQLGGEAAVSIGCIQGSNCGDGLLLNRGATRELYGMRPKQLLVTLVQQLGAALGCTRVHLVDNRNRVVIGALRQGKVCADYDGLWREMGAVERADGDFELPCAVLGELDVSEIASSKRSEARKRHALVCQLADDVNARLGSCLL